MEFSRGHALLIGVGAYQYEPALSVPNRWKMSGGCPRCSSIQTIAGILKSRSTSCTTRRQPAAILGALDGLASQTTSDDTVMIVYGGHGLRDASGGYHLTDDSRRRYGKFVAGSGGASANSSNRSKRSQHAGPY